MEILIEDIKEGGLEIEGSEKDSWYAGLLTEALGDIYRSAEPARVSVHVVRFEDNITIDGRAEFTTHKVCDRCLKEFSHTANVHFHAVLVPFHDEREHLKKDEVELKEEDLEFGYYEGDRFDLAEVIREQILLCEPMQSLCREDCKGLCQSCGKNLNEGPCGCVQEHADSRWNALKNVKISRN